MRTLIIGGGLSGLALAEMLQARGHDYLLLEAKNRFGGRILTEQHATGCFDLGPSWFWPEQPRIAALIDRLGLKKFDQYADGLLTSEDEQGRVQRGRGIAPMQGSWRMKGGLGKLTQALADRLPPEKKRLNAQVSNLSNIDGQIAVMLHDGDTITADQVVLALPLRIAAQLDFTPALPDRAHHLMQNTATWMAGQAKAVAVYEQPFWRKAGLSGDAMSRRGPMVEIHDASPAQGGPYALFGFIGVPPRGRLDQPLLRQHIRAQFERLFGAEAAKPVKLYVKDWAVDPHISTEADKPPMMAHPTYGILPELNGAWKDVLFFAGTEVAPQFGGYLEGALEAAETALARLENAQIGYQNGD